MSLTRRFCFGWRNRDHCCGKYQTLVRSNLGCVDDRDTDGKRDAKSMLTRRTLLQRAGWIAAASASPLRRALAAESISPAMDKLSRYMSEACNRDLPGEVLGKLKEHILDTFAAMISGSELPPGHAALQFARAYNGEKIAIVVCSKVLCGPVEAALANGVLAHADETDDSHNPSGSHPGCAIIPAALAMGEQCGISGTQFLRAVALGYDVGTRLTMTLGPDFGKGHKDDHSVAGVFGAAAAAASTATLNPQQMRWVLDYAAQQSSGITAWQRDTDHIEKAFVFGGMPARSGVTAALLVRSAWTGVDDIFSGSDNFLAAYAPQADPSGLTDRLGERYEVMRTNIKKWTVGTPLQAPLDALQSLLKKHPFEPDQVQQVLVRVPNPGDLMTICEMPDLCLPYMSAVMMTDKTASFHAAHDKSRMEDPAILRHRAKVQIVADPTLENQQPWGEVPRGEAIVEVTLADGTHLTEHAEAVRGTPNNPMTREEVLAKSRDLMTPVVGSTVCTKLIETVLGLETVKDIRDLRPLLQHV